MNLDKKKGFTLIELLVVIAIIGILSSVVLASLNIAREKAKDSAIKSDMETIRVQAELYYGDNGNSYGPDSGSCASGMFWLDPVIKSAKNHIISTMPTPVINCWIKNSGQTWAFVVPLWAGSSYWCADSSGSVGLQSNHSFSIDGFCL